MFTRWKDCRRGPTVRRRDPGASCGSPYTLRPIFGRRDEPKEKSCVAGSVDRDGRACFLFLRERPVAAEHRDPDRETAVYPAAGRKPGIAEVEAERQPQDGV